MTFEDRCPWCANHVLIRPGEATYCPTPGCSHRADLPRSCCDCALCGRTPPGYVGSPPAPPPAEGYAHGA